MIFLCATACAHAQTAPIPISTAPLTYSIRLEEYTGMALDKSLRSKIARGNLESGRFGWEAARKILYLPSLSAGANATRNYTDNDLKGTLASTTPNPVRNNSANGTLSLSQPFLTGTDLSVGAMWDFTETRSLDKTFYTSTRDQPQLNTTLNQPLFFFVRNPRLRAKRRADLNWADVQSQFDSDNLDITFTANGFYYNALLSRESVEVEQKKFESAQAVYRITRSLVHAGKLAPVELGRAEIRLQLDSRRIDNARIQSKQALNRLKDFVLLPAEAEIELLSSLRYTPFSWPLERLIREADDHNPGILNARRQIELAKISLSEAGEGNRPLVNLQGNYMFNGDHTVYGYPRQQPFAWTAGVGTSWPIFDASQTRLRVQQGQIAVENARRSYMDLERQVQLSVRNAYLDVKRIEDQIRDFTAQRRIARQNVEAVRLQYANGLSRLIDVFDAENEQRDLELEYLNLLVSFNQSRDNLSRSVGVDVEKLKP